MIRRRTIRTIVTVALALALLAGACSDDGDTTSTDDATTTTESAVTTTTEAETPAETTTTIEAAPDDPVDSPAPYAGYVSEIYDDPAVWICWPGADDTCAENQDLTLVAPDGSLEVVPFTPVDDAPVDCFYVYPTISGDQTPNSDFDPQPEQEIFTTRSQAARYGSVCRVFAPVYRQNTLASMTGRVQADEGVDTYAVAYADVLDAFKYYMATANEGRGFVLLGHSQGAGLIANLIAEEIDGVPGIQDQFVTAHILGSSARAYDTIPGCTEVGEIGCVISYATFRETAPPPSNSFFGRNDAGPALCTNPANLEGSAATTHPEYLFNAGSAAFAGASPFTDPADAEAITTPWVGYPDFIVAECVDDGTFGYLSIEILGDPADPRTDDINGDLTPEWGLHLADAQVAMGDLVALVDAQISAYAG
ncbi:MAG: DUF3089 domain-containing protein [Acidimicrobiales bacterium]